MQELVMQGMQQNTLYRTHHAQNNMYNSEYSHILQPSKYMIVIVPRFSCMNNNVTKYVCHTYEYLCILVFILTLSTAVTKKYIAIPTELMGMKWLNP